MYVQKADLAVSGEARSLRSTSSSYPEEAGHGSHPHQIPKTARHLRAESRPEVPNMGVSKLDYCIQRAVNCLAGQGLPSLGCEDLQIAPYGHVPRVPGLDSPGEVPSPTEVETIATARHT